MGNEMKEIRRMLKTQKAGFPVGVKQEVLEALIYLDKKLSQIWRKEK